MGKCLFCDTQEESWDKEQKGYLIANIGAEDNHIHVHGTLDDKDTMKELIDASIEYSELDSEYNGLKKPDFKLKEIVFHNRQRLGDMLMFTCGIRDFKKAYPDIRVNVISIASHIWDHNPNIDRTLVATDENTIKIGPGKLTNASNRLDWHFANAFRVSIEDALHISIPQGETKPDVWLTKEEYKAPRVDKRPYWIIVIGGEKGWGCKMYPFEKWQEFVAQNPDTLFYQLGTNEDNHPRLQGDNVVDYIGKTQSKDNGIRDLYKLFLNAEGSIGLVSFHMHLSAAFGKPCIVIAGAREPVSFTRYPGHQYLNTEGTMPCAIKACWKCNIDACTNLVLYPERKLELDRKVPKCADMIEPEDLTKALNSYYVGERLVKNTPSEKPTFTNVVNEINPTTLVQKQEFDNTTKYGIDFGGGSFTSKDWFFIQNLIKEHKVKTFLEFGAGLSTLFLNDENIKVTTFETQVNWIKKIKEINPKANIRLWDGKQIPDDQLLEKYDMVFVDGPAGGSNREFSTKIASEKSNVIVVHDAGREYERKWQTKYLQSTFSGPGKGGHRCHLWTKEIKKSFSHKPGGKFIKFISTARGWGGCARSITTIMKLLLEQGHKVEFIPFRNKVSSREFQDCIKNELQGLIVTENYNTVKEKCDVLFMYADDYIWEFKNPELADIFSNLQADKKIMMLNYRRGSVGTVEWTRNWNKYMFLNSTQEQELLKVHPGVSTKVLPPCTDLSKFFEVEPRFERWVKIVRHNSQGDTKFAKNVNDEICNVLQRNDLEICMMPGPSFVKEIDGFYKVLRNICPIPEFLGKGNLFWYSLPEGYMDMGPRVILEAMAAGLPIIADNWGGAVDRVTPDCGWLCNSKEEMIEIIKNVTLEELKEKGKASRERALQEFTHTNWIKEILN